MKVYVMRRAYKRNYTWHAKVPFTANLYSPGQRIGPDCDFTIDHLWMLEIEFDAIFIETYFNFTPDASRKVHTCVKKIPFVAPFNFFIPQGCSREREKKCCSFGKGEHAFDGAHLLPLFLQPSFSFLFFFFLELANLWSPSAFSQPAENTLTWVPLSPSGTV